jgi:hypothetical protein
MCVCVDFVIAGIQFSVVTLLHIYLYMVHKRHA